MASLQLKPLDYTTCACFLAYSASASITPISLVILIQELNTQLTEGGLIETVRSLLVFIVLFASGFIAGRFGKVHALGLGCIILSVGLAGFALAPSYGFLLCAVALIGLGSGILEGLINPLVQDMHPHDSGRYLNLVNGFWSVGVLATVLISGELLTHGISWRLIAGCLSAYSLVIGILFFVFDRQSPEVTAIPAKKILRQMKDICRHKGFWIFIPIMFFAGGTEGAFIFWSATLIQLEFDGLARAAGIGTACFASGMMAGRFGAGWLVAQHKLRGYLLGSCVLGLAVSTLVFAVGSLPALYAILFIAGLSVAILWPSIQSYAAEVLPVDSTLLFILLSCAGIPGFAVTAAIMGWVGDQFNLLASFTVPMLMFGALFLFLLVEPKYRQKVSPQ